jgi:hypothetical protein
MNSDNRARLRVAALIWCMVNAVVFGIGVILVVSVPALMAHAFFWIPAVVVSSLAISAPLSLVHRALDDDALQAAADHLRLVNICSYQK